MAVNSQTVVQMLGRIVRFCILVWIISHISPVHSFDYSFSSFYSAPNFWKHSRAINREIRQALPQKEHSNSKRMNETKEMIMKSPADCTSLMTPECRGYVKVISAVKRKIIVINYI